MVYLELSESNPFTSLKVTLLLEAVKSGQVAASIREFPYCRVKAETREEAIAQIKATFLERVKNLEAISWNVPIPETKPTWTKFSGVFKYDADFAAFKTLDDCKISPIY